MLENIQINKLEKATPSMFNNIQNLLHQHKPESDPISLNLLKKIINDPSIEIFIAVNSLGTIKGMVTMIMHSKLEGLSKAWVEDLIVDKGQRRQGIGEKLMERLLKEAKNNNIKSVVLTSNSSRIAANALYKKIGFNREKTQYYKFNFNK